MTPQQTIEDEGWSFGDWIQANQRAVTIGLAIVAIGGIGYWFYMRSAEIKRRNAERGMNQAKQSLAAGNAALAMTDLQRVSDRYKGTSAGAQSAMILAELQYRQGKYADGVKALETYTSSSAAGPNLAAVWSLIGDGQVGAGKLAEALSAYQKAAEATPYAGERALYDAKRAKALMAAGRDADALVIWQKLEADPEALVVRNEARIHVSELTAKPAGKS